MKTIEDITEGTFSGDKITGRDFFNSYIDQICLEVVEEMTTFTGGTVLEFVDHAIRSEIKFRLDGMVDAFPEYVEKTAGCLDIEL